MDPIVIALIIIAAIVLVPLIWLIATYNSLVALRNHLRESWADIDVELKRRYDLIPNLVETVKGYAKHESETFARVAELRSRAIASTGTPASQAVDESALLMGLKQVFVLAEQYPALKADTHFLALQKQLAETEDRIAAARRFFNANVRDLNLSCQQFPSSIAASIFGFKPETYFELTSEAERVVPRVSI